MSDKQNYYKVDFGLDVCSNALSMITSIDGIIAQLVTTAMLSVQKGNLYEYEIDTGQSKQRVRYQTPSEVAEAINFYRKLRKTYEKDATPKVTRFVSGKNIR